MAEPDSFRVSADAYRRYVGRYGSALGSAVADRAGVSSGMRALDVGCGPGALTAILADRLGPGAVSACDPSEPFVEACAAQNPGVDVRLAPGEKLPFADGDFDVALSQLVINFMSDAEAGIREKRRVVRAGGTVAAATWDYAGEMTLLRAFWDAALAVDRDRAYDLDEGRVMRYCSREELASLFALAGLESIEVAPIVVTAAYEDFEDLWDPIPAGVGPSGAFCASLPDEGRAELKEELRRLLGSPDGPFELTARAWCGTGRVPRV